MHVARRHRPQTPTLPPPHQVNGVKGNVHRMYEALRKEGVLELVVPRPMNCCRRMYHMYDGRTLGCSVPDET